MNAEDEKALDVLRAKRAELGTKKVAEILGYAEASIRLACAGKYPGKLDKLLGEVRRAWIAVVFCPYVEEQIPLDGCFERSTAPEPYGGGARLAWWRACQECPHRGKLEEPGHG